MRRHKEIVLLVTIPNYWRVRELITQQTRKGTIALPGITVGVSFHMSNLINRVYALLKCILVLVLVN